MIDQDSNKEYLIETIIFSGMLRKPKIGGIPSDLWLFNVVISMRIFININPIIALFNFLVLYGALFIVCLWDDDVCSLLKVKFNFLNNPAHKIIGCNGYVAY
jgi:type IV secretory pathway VirB3-like protein